MCILLHNISYANNAPSNKNRLEILLSTQKNNTENYNVTKDFEKYFKNPDHLSDNTNTKVIAASDMFMGRNYAYDPLGDGENGDFDTRSEYNTSSFDCMSFVSTILALTQSNNLNDFYNKIKLVRYGKKPASFFNRHHFISTQWNTENSRLGFLQDYTVKILSRDNKPLAEIASGTVNYPQWLIFQKKLLANKKTLSKKQLKIWKTVYDKSQQEKSFISYIPISKIISKTNNVDNFILKQIPPGSIIEFVTPNWNLKKQIGTELDVMHLGLIIHNKGKIILRHAGTKKGVHDIELSKYLNYVNSHIKQIKGFHIEKIRIN